MTIYDGCIQNIHKKQENVALQCEKLRAELSLLDEQSVLISDIRDGKIEPSLDVFKKVSWIPDIEYTGLLEDMFSKIFPKARSIHIDRYLHKINFKLNGICCALQDTERISYVWISVSTKWMENICDSVYKNQMSPEDAMKKMESTYKKYLQTVEELKNSDGVNRVTVSKLDRTGNLEYGTQKYEKMCKKIKNYTKQAPYISYDDEKERDDI